MIETLRKTYEYRTAEGMPGIQGVGVFIVKGTAKVLDRTPISVDSLISPKFELIDVEEFQNVYSVTATYVTWFADDTPEAAEKQAEEFSLKGERIGHVLINETKLIGFYRKEKK